MAGWKNDSSGNAVPPVWNGTEAVPMEVDKSLNFGVIDSGHKNLHKWLMFSYCDDLASAAVWDTDYYISVPSDRTAHLLSQVSSDNAGIVTIYEAPTITVNGSAQTPVNRNRASSNTPGMLIYKGPTNTGLGTMLCKERFWSTNKAGGMSRESDEWILKSNTKYLIRVTNSVINANVDLKLTWYEILN